MGRIGSLSYNSFDSYRTSSSALVKTQNIHKFHYQNPHLDLDINANIINSNAPNRRNAHVFLSLFSFKKAALRSGHALGLFAKRRES